MVWPWNPWVALKKSNGRGYPLSDTLAELRNEQGFSASISNFQGVHASHTPLWTCVLMDYILQLGVKRTCCASLEAILTKLLPIHQQNSTKHGVVLQRWTFRSCDAFMWGMNHETQKLWIATANNMIVLDDQFQLMPWRSHCREAGGRL